MYRIEMPMRESSRYEPRDRIPLFNLMKNYFNERVGGYVYRSELHYITRYYNPSTVDTYRSYFTSAGFLIFFRVGKYHVFKEIPYNMTLADVRWEGEYRKKKKLIKKIYVSIHKSNFITKDEFNV